MNPERSGRWWADLAALTLIISLFAMLLLIGRQMTAPMVEEFEIDLSLVWLPYYTALSLTRGFCAYALSLAFTLVYGTIAAHHARAERFMLPVLDVLQAIPVLGFLPGLVIAMIRLFPTRELGLEFASIVMIFTGQVWNMTFSYHASLRSIPPALREVATVQRLTPWQFFRFVELPSSAIGLVWNSMMSMAGGWFFLTVTEAFTLGEQTYRLPGIGAYMSIAIERGDVAAMLGATLAMIGMIIAVDQIVWRPLVVWSQRFKFEDVAAAEHASSWVLDLLRGSRLVRRLSAIGSGAALLRVKWWPKQLASVAPTERAANDSVLVPRGIRQVLRFCFLGVLVVLVTVGASTLVRLLGALPATGHPGGDWQTVAWALGATFLRTTAAVVIGAAWTIPAGVLIGMSPRWSQRLQPVIQVVASFPAPMVFPLATMFLDWSHIPFTYGCVLLMTLGTQWYVLFNVIAGAQAIPADLREVAAVFRLATVSRWWRLYLPCVFPYLVTGLVTAAGGAWNATIVAELVMANGETHIAFGLGSLIQQATARGDFPLLAAGVTVTAASVVLINRVVWKRLYRLAHDRYRLAD